MEGETKKNDLESLLAAIKSSDGLESRISLISQIGDSCQADASNLTIVAEILTTCWEDTSSVDILQCMLNKTILHVAEKYLESDISNCLSQFLILGTKANIWCNKLLQMTVTSVEKLQDEEHSNLFPQLILDSLSFSSATVSILTRSPVLGEKVVMLIIENFLFELLNLTKASIFEVQRIHSIASEVLKVAQVVLDAAVKLCRAYFQTLRRDYCEMNINRREDCDRIDYSIHIVSITACTIECLCELGTFAAFSGGNLVTVLNVSWKGVVSLLQLGKGVLAEKVNIGDIILALISLATESLRSAAETCSSSFKESLTISEAKRMFLPIKFYLINAVRISSEYPCQAVNVHREITQCVLLISSLGISLSKETHLRAVSEALAEFLEPTSFLLLHTLLNSADVKADSRFKVLECLFACEMDYSSTNLEKDVDSSAKSVPLDSIFSVHSDALTKTDGLMLGRVILFLNLLKTSSALREEIVHEISGKLDYLMNSLLHEDVYSAVLGLQVPVLDGFGPIAAVIWQPMFSCTLRSLKTFMIVATYSEVAWIKMEAFLLQNLFHPHFLCLEIVTELWSFFIRHAETNLINHIFDRLHLLLKIIGSSEPVLNPHSFLRKMARQICNFLSYTTTEIVNQFYNSIMSDEESYLSSVLFTALLMEGFPVDLLSDNLKTSATWKVVSAFYGFIDSNFKELRLDGSSGYCNSDLLGLPVLALSSALRAGQINGSDVIDDKQTSQVLKFTTSLVRGLKNTTDAKDYYPKLLGGMLDIISTKKHLYFLAEMEELILELQTIFTSDYDATLYCFGPSLASFLASLSHMEIAEDEGNLLSSAIWSLHHVLLRERHWAFIHLAVAAFGYFAARTSCTQLWRFVPLDAALSFDCSTGKNADENKFMIELKAFLEKEVALWEVTSCKEQLIHLVEEGMVLRKLGNVPNTVPDNCEAKIEDVIEDDSVNKKKRKLPNGVWEGMELLQSGLKTVSNALAEADSVEIKEAFSPHISCLENVISHLVGLSSAV